MYRRDEKGRWYWMDGDRRVFLEHMDVAKRQKKLERGKREEEPKEVSNDNG